MFNFYTKKQKEWTDGSIKKPYSNVASSQQPNVEESFQSINETHEITSSRISKLENKLESALSHISSLEEEIQQSTILIQDLTQAQGRIDAKFESFETNLMNQINNQFQNMFSKLTQLHHYQPTAAAPNYYQQSIPQTAIQIQHANHPTNLNNQEILNRINDHNEQMKRQLSQSPTYQNQNVQIPTHPQPSSSHPS